MATFTVTTLDDDDFGGGDLATEQGDGTGLSLREAIELANGNAGADVIEFDLGLTGGTLTLFNGEMGVSGDLAIAGDIDGDGKADITIDANLSSRIFTVGGAANVSVDGMTLGYGSDFNGGAVAILSGAKLTMTNSVVSDSGAYVGGGIYVDANGELVLENSVVTGNFAAFSGGGVVVAPDGHATIVNSLIHSNYASFGAAIGVYGTVTVANTTLTGNAALAGGGAYVGKTGTLSLVNSTIVENVAEYGGGVVNSGTASISSSTLTGNYAYYAGGGVLNGSYCGCYTGVLTVTNSIVAGNYAYGGGYGGDPGSEIYSVDPVGFGGVNVIGVGADGDASDGVIQAPTLGALFLNVGISKATGLDAGLVSAPGGFMPVVEIVQGGVAHEAGDFSALPSDAADVDGDGNTAEMLPVDQLGAPRIQIQQLDIGAVEIDPGLVVRMTDSLQTDLNGNGFADVGDTISYFVDIANPESGVMAAYADVVFELGPDADFDLVAGSVFASQGSVVLGNTLGDTSVQVAVGTVAESASVAISFSVTVGSTAASIVSAQGQVTGKGLALILTDDPDYGTPVSDPTLTGQTPIAADDAFATTEATAISGANLFADNGSGVDLGLGFAIVAVNGDAGNVGNQFTLASGALLTVNADGTFDYDPNDAWDHLPGPLSGASNLIGLDNFAYTLSGGDVATVTITLSGLDTVDTLDGIAGPDKLFGGNFDDILLGTVGADVLDGQAGSDTASYVNSTAGVILNLTTNLGTGGFAGSDSFVSVENLTGSTHADTLYGDAEANVLEGHAGADWIDGRGGADTASYAFSDAAVSVDLATGKLSGGHADGDTLRSIENLIGSTFDDTLTGDDGSNVLEGGGGADALFGGGGTDAASYAGAGAGVVASLLAGGSGGDAAGDTFDAIEVLEGSDFGDMLTGNTGVNILSGGGGDDALNASLGDDSLFGGDGDDNLTGSGGADMLVGDAGTDTANYSNSTAAVTVSLTTGATAGGHAAGDTFFSIESLFGSEFNDSLTGNAFANTLFGYNGDDILAGLGGADVLWGGNGVDTASYAASGAGVTVSLLAGTGSGGHAQGDTLLSIENVSGSSFGDTITGSVEDNSLEGRDGSDVLNGSNGTDVLLGGAGDDNLTGGNGGDTIDGGAGTDTANYANSTAAVIVNLAAQTASGGHATGDTLVSIENAFGSALADTMTAAATGSTLNGYGGSDVLNDNVGDDVLIGGLGDDTLVSGDGDDVLSGGDGLDQFVFTTASFGDDVIIGFRPRQDGVFERLDFSAVGLDMGDFAIVDGGGGVVLTHVDGLGGVNTLTLLGVTSGDLEAGNWV